MRRALQARLLYDLRSADASSSHMPKAMSNTTHAALPACEYAILKIL